MIWTDLAGDLCLAWSQAVMWSQLTHHDVPPPLLTAGSLSGVWWSTSQPAVSLISPRYISDRERKGIVREKQKTQSSCRENSGSAGSSAWSCVDSENRMLHSVTGVCFPQKQTDLFLFKTYQTAWKMHARWFEHHSSCWTFQNNFIWKWQNWARAAQSCKLIQEILHWEEQDVFLSQNKKHFYSPLYENKLVTFPVAN